MNSGTGLRILVVEDDPVIGPVMTETLGDHGYRVTWCATAAEAEQAIGIEAPAIVLLDAGLPDGDGFELCRSWRATHRDLPVILVTARDDEIDIVEGLDAGANDYIAKPFSMRVLLARVRTQLRQVDTAAPSPIVVGRLRVEPASYQAFIDDIEVPMRPREFELLSILAREAGNVVTRERLLADIWDVHWPTSSKTIEVHMVALRRYLRDVIEIVSIRGVGYRLETP